MNELSGDAQRTLQALFDIQTRGGGERQTHTDRAIKVRAGLDSSRMSAALEELTSGGYVAPNMSLWEGPPSLTTFRLENKGRQALDPLPPPSPETQKWEGSARP